MATPFILSTDPAALDDLRARLRATRWPDAPDDAGWALGTDVDYLRDLVAYWMEGFDWLAVEAELNRLPHARSEIGGLGIHYVHARAAEGSPSVLPIVLSHGWPDSFWRYSKVIPMLTHPEQYGGDSADAFDVVVPDMPGFGYSDRPPQPLDSIAVAGLWAELMTELGYGRFTAAGGDIGSHVSRYLALDHADRVIAVHRMDGGLPPASINKDTLSAAEREWLDTAATWGATEGAYMAMHRTKPQTAAFGLTDSPVGLAAWIVEKLRSWSDDFDSSFTRDDVLTIVTMYWLTGTIASSMRMYAANALIDPAQLARRVEVPSGFSVLPRDQVRPPTEWLERSSTLASATTPPRGGHFAPIEEPELYVNELREFFRDFR